MATKECFLCGNDTGHHLGCMASVVKGLTPAAARAAGLLPQLEAEPEPVVDEVEVLRENSMTTVPVVGDCEFTGCDNPKYSNHPRVKFCEDHKDPKNRKE